MNVQIRIDPSFTAAVHWNEEFLINEYELQINMVTKTEDQFEQSIAMERLKYMLHHAFTNAVFINQNDNKQCKHYVNAGMKVVNLPHDPVDQIVGIMLYCKLNAVMEQRILINSILISSSLGDQVWYQHESDENTGPFETSGYWHESDPTYCNQKYRIRRDDRIVKITNNDAWNSLNLAWPHEKTYTKDNSVVIYGDFKRDED